MMDSATEEMFRAYRKASRMLTCIAVWVALFAAVVVAAYMGWIPEVTR